MRYTIHKLCIDLMSDTATRFCVLAASLSICCMIKWNISRCCSLDQLICLVNSIRNLTFYHTLTIKTVHWHLRICCYNNTVCIVNFLLCQHILCTTGSACLDLNGNPCCCCCFLQAFSRHIRMCDSCRTGSNGQHLCCLSCL